MTGSTLIWILVATVAGRMVQLYLTYQQSVSFNADIRRLRRSGAVSVGLGGKRYRGGRAFVAIALDDREVVRDAMTLQGLTTFARGRPLRSIHGTTVAHLLTEQDVPGLSKPQRLAARQAAELFRAAHAQDGAVRAGAEPREGAVAG